MAPGALERGNLPLQDHDKEVLQGSARSKVIKPTVPQKKMDHGRPRSRTHDRTDDRMSQLSKPSATPVQPSIQLTTRGSTGGAYWGATSPAYF